MLHFGAEMCAAVATVHQNDTEGASVGAVVREEKSKQRLCVQSQILKVHDSDKKSVCVKEKGDEVRNV